MHSLCTNINTGQHTQQSLFEPFPVASLTPVQGKKVTLDFQGGSITSDAGVLLLSETESRTGIISLLANCTPIPVDLLQLRTLSLSFWRSVSTRSPAVTRMAMTAIPCAMTLP